VGVGVGGIRVGIIVGIGVGMAVAVAECIDPLGFSEENIVAITSKY
jgi:hypothetical protein